MVNRRELHQKLENKVEVSSWQNRGSKWGVFPGFATFDDTGG
jgi:hypothetical protein